MEYWMCASSDWLQSCGSISKIIIIIQINFMYSLCHKRACTLWCFCKVLVLQIYAKGWLDVSEATSSLATRRNTSRSVVLCTLYLHTLTHMCHMNYVYPHDVDCKEIISVYTHWPVQEFCHDNSHKIHSSCTCAYMHAHTHTRIYIYTSMHAHSHSHTHTHTHMCTHAYYVRFDVKGVHCIPDSEFLASSGRSFCLSPICDFQPIFAWFTD